MNLCLIWGFLLPTSNIKEQKINDKFNSLRSLLQHHLQNVRCCGGNCIASATDNGHHVGKTSVWWQESVTQRIYSMIKKMLARNWWFHWNHTDRVWWRADNHLPQQPRLATDLLLLLILIPNNLLYDNSQTIVKNNTWCSWIDCGLCAKWTGTQQKQFGLGDAVFFFFFFKVTSNISSDCFCCSCRLFW